MGIMRLHQGGISSSRNHTSAGFIFPSLIERELSQFETTIYWKTGSKNSLLVLFKMVWENWNKFNTQFQFMVGKLKNDLWVAHPNYVLRKGESKKTHVFSSWLSRFQWENVRSKPVDFHFEKMEEWSFSAKRDKKSKQFFCWMKPSTVIQIQSSNVSTDRSCLGGWFLHRLRVKKTGVCRVPDILAIPASTVPSKKGGKNEGAILSKNLPDFMDKTINQASPIWPFSYVICVQTSKCFKVKCWSLVHPGESRCTKRLLCFLPWWMTPARDNDSKRWWYGVFNTNERMKNEGE